MLRLIRIAPGVVPDYRRILHDLGIDYVFSAPDSFMFPQCENGTYRKISRGTDFLTAKFGLAIITVDIYV